jgi:hypothetical protein
VHHEVNLGYGAAVRTGIRTALTETGYSKIFLTDSDGQFTARELPEFLELARTERADAVIGYRRPRADPLNRKLNAFLWTQASRLLLRTGTRDVDCAYKLIDRRVLTDVDLRTNEATISPEMLAKLRANGARVIQRPVHHYPRRHGNPTGADLSVVLRSLRGFLDIYRESIREGRQWRVVHRLLRPRDRVLALVTATATVLSVGSYIYFARRHEILAYPDAVSHLLIARRVVAGSTPGLAQLGGVWLPLPHLLDLPGVWVRGLYYSGLAGSVVSQVSYVLAVHFLYRIGVGITRSRIAGVVAAAVFGINANVLYLQSTPMTEMLLLACVAASIYYLMRWCQTGSYRYLAGASAATLLATLTRYEGWVLLLGVMFVVGVASWRRRAGYAQTEANLVFFGLLGASGVVGWILWNTAIFHRPLYFQNGAFARPSLWVSSGDKAIGSWGVSMRTYLIAMQDNFGPVALGLAVVGLAYYLVRTRLRAETLAPLVSLIFLPFFVYALYSGQRPLHVTQISGDLYNVRFGLVMVVPLAIFAAYLVSAARAVGPRRLRQATYGALCLGVGLALVSVGGITTRKEAEVFRASRTEQANAVAAAWLRAHYDHGRVLMESFGNETVTFASHIPSQAIIYEGSYRMWAPALAHPTERGIRWIYMRRSPSNEDDTWRRLHGTNQLTSYALVYQDPNRLVYRHRDGTVEASPGRQPLGHRTAAAGRGRSVSQAAS